MNSEEQCEGMIMQAEETLGAAEEGVKSGRRASLKIGQQGGLQGITQLRAQIEHQQSQRPWRRMDPATWLPHGSAAPLTPSTAFRT